MATKLGRMVAHLTGLLPIKSQKFWSCGLAKSRGKTKPLYIHCHSAYSHQTRMLTYLESLPLIKLLDPFSRVLERSRDKLKSLYLHYHSTYSQQTCQVEDLLEGFLLYRHMTFNWVFLLDYVTILKNLYLHSH